MKYILKHRDLAYPIILPKETRDSITESLRRGNGTIIFDDYVLSPYTLSIVPQDVFLLSDSEELARAGKERCRWGTVYDRGVHRCSDSRCQERARRDSPYVLPETWERADAAVNAPKAATESARVDKRTIIAVTERGFRSGRPVLRTLMKFYRENRTQVSPDIALVCRKFDGMPMEQIPRRSSADFSVS